MNENKLRSDLKYERQVEELGKRGEEFLANANTAVSDALARMNNRIEEMKGELHAQGPGIQNSLSEIRTKTDALRTEMRSLAGAIAWDHLVFGFWVPLVFASTSVLVSLPRALAEIKPAIASAAACLSPHFMTCFTPQPPTVLSQALSVLRSMLGL